MPESDRRPISLRTYRVIAAVVLAGAAVLWLGKAGDVLRVGIASAVSLLGEPAVVVLPWVLSPLPFVVLAALLLAPVRRRADAPAFTAANLQQALERIEAEVPGARGTGRNELGLYLCLSALVLPPALTWALSDGPLSVLMEPQWLTPIAGAAALGGGLWAAGRGPWWLGAACAALAAPCAIYTVSLWIEQRTSVLRIEIALAAMLGALPGLALFFVLRRLLR